MLDLAGRQILSIVFASGEAVEISRVAQAIGAKDEVVIKYLPTIRETMRKAGMPFELLHLSDKLQLCTSPEHAPVIRAALEIRRNTPLSQAALEVLAIVAYNQPVTRAFVEQVRGVDSAGVMSSLQEKELIDEAGRLDLPGRPISYKTTVNFLRCFNIESIDKLPTLPNAEDDELAEEIVDGQVAFDELGV